MAIFRAPDNGVKGLVMGFAKLIPVQNLPACQSLRSVELLREAIDKVAKSLLGLSLNAEEIENRTHINCIISL